MLNNIIVELESGVTMLDSTVDNCEQCWQKTLVKPIFNNLATTCSFSVVYAANQHTTDNTSVRYERLKNNGENIVLNKIRTSVALRD